jgi:hypothetical protein
MCIRPANVYFDRPVNVEPCFAEYDAGPTRISRWQAFGIPQVTASCRQEASRGIEGDSDRALQDRERIPEGDPRDREEGAF